MKKISILNLIIFSLLFSSCYDNNFLSIRFEEKDINVSNCKDKNIYLVRVNNSTNSYTSYEAGYVLSDNNVIMDNSLNKYQDFKLNENQLINDTSYVDVLNYQYINSLQKNVARSNLTNYSVVDNSYSVASTKTIKMLNKDQKSCTNRTAVCKYTSDKCNVWYIESTKVNTAFTNKSISLFSQSDFQKIGQTFDTICNLEEQTNGSHLYTQSSFPNLINPQKRIDIIIGDLFDDVSNTSETDSGTFGYFYSVDMDKTKENSNKTQAIYLDSYFYKRAEKQTISTLVHEFNHLLNYVNKQVIYGINYSTWYTEMLSLVTEDLFQNYLENEDKYSPKARSCYFTNYAYYGFGYWLSDDAVFCSYANAYIFGAYLGRNFGGPDLISEIAKNPYGGVESINQALITKNQKHFNASTNQYVYDDFDYVLTNEFNILFNENSYDVSQNTGNDKNPLYFTVNNKYPLVSSIDNSIKFTGFSLKNSLSYTSNPKDFYNYRENSTYNARDLYSYGFDVCLICKDCQQENFNIKLKRKENVDYKYFTFVTTK